MISGSRQLTRIATAPCIRGTACTAAGALLIVLCARLEIPAWPVPVTGQTLGVLLAGGILGVRLGPAAVGGYLALGAAGLPVFAGAANGLTAFAGPTAGYLAGFLPAAWLAGLLTERTLSRGFPVRMAVLVLAALAVYVPGLLWLSRFVGPDRAADLGLFPFLPGDLLKAAAATLLIPSGRRFLAASRGR